MKLCDWFNDVARKNCIKFTQCRQILLRIEHFKTSYSEKSPISIQSNMRNNINQVLSEFFHPNPEAFMKQLQSHGGNATYRHGIIRLSYGQRYIKQIKQLRCFQAS